MSKYWPQGLQIGFPNYLMVSSFFFQPRGPIQCHKVEHLLVTWGRLKIFFPSSAFTPSVKSPCLGLISTFSPTGMLDLS